MGISYFSRENPQNLKIRILKNEKYKNVFLSSVQDLEKG
jgi:hypothetical protein